VFGTATGISGGGTAGYTAGTAEAMRYFAAAEFAGAVDSTGSGTFSGIVSPNLASPTGGSGSSNGALNIGAVASGSADYDPIAAVGFGESAAARTGSATNFGGGQASATNYLGTAGGVASGTGSGTASGGGASPLGDAVGTAFSGSGGATGNFNNGGQGYVGGSSAGIRFPCEWQSICVR